MDNKKVWIITGTSSGLGRQIVKSVLARGDKVIATSRDVSKIADLESPACKLLQLDVTGSPDTLCEAARKAIDLWGYISVVVNNAGTTILGSVEELGQAAFMEQYQTNVFGVLNVTNAFLPFMRERKDGIIVIVGSRSAWQANAPMIGAYASSKAAIHSIAETLSAELSPFQIKILLVEPGSMRTSNLQAAHVTSSKYPPLDVPVYAAFRAAGHKFLKDIEGKQPGNPANAAERIVDVVRGEGSAEGKGWPSILTLGKDARQGVTSKCQAVMQTVEDWSDVGEIDY